MFFFSSKYATDPLLIGALGVELHTIQGEAGRLATRHHSYPPVESANLKNIHSYHPLLLSLLREISLGFLSQEIPFLRYASQIHFLV